MNFSSKTLSQTWHSGFEDSASNKTSCPEIKTCKPNVVVY